jgi:hypothetical protein
MATIRHINEEEYAAKALELLNHRREGYVNYALSLLKQSMSPGQASEKLEDKVKDEMETVLFEYLKHRGIVNGEIRHVYNTYGYCRRIRRTPSKRDVPSNLLDIKAILPNYEEVIGNVLVDAEQLWIISEVEAAKEMAKREVIISP